MQVENTKEIKLYKEKIINYLKDEKIENKLRVKDLKRAYQVLQIIDENEYDQLKNEVFKDNINGLKELVKLLEEEGNKVEILKSLLDKADFGFPTFDDLKTNNNLFNLLLFDNFIDIFDDKEKANDFLSKLINISYKDINNKGVGRGELFLFSLFQNTTNAIKGDVNIDGNEIEVKMSTSNSSNGGRVMASNLNLKSPKDIQCFIEDKFNIKNIKLGGYTILNDLIKRFDNEEIGFKSILEGLLYQFPWYSTEKLNQLNNFINKIGIDRNHLGQQLIRLHGCLALIEYCNADNWKYLLVGNTSNGNYYIIDSKNCGLDNFEKSIENLYHDYHFVFKDGPLNSDGANNRNYVSTIYVSIKSDIFKN